MEYLKDLSNSELMRLLRDAKEQQDSQMIKNITAEYNRRSTYDE